MSGTAFAVGKLCSGAVVWTAGEALGFGVGFTLAVAVFDFACGLGEGVAFATALVERCVRPAAVELGLGDGRGGICTSVRVVVTVVLGGAGVGVGDG